uniref:Uncharacterized protein n=1 Tax=Magnetococcus massalia (strain MO-1) TaxID=451514 RepID=A0A1S7LDT5_MAGMO|nr:Protein of unknown function [Candidatus Magnetococcus massalia]
MSTNPDFSPKHHITGRNGKRQTRAARIQTGQKGLHFIKIGIKKRTDDIFGRDSETAMPVKRPQITPEEMEELKEMRRKALGRTPKEKGVPPASAPLETSQIVERADTNKSESQNGIKKGPEQVESTRPGPALKNAGEVCRSRTCDPVIKSHLLYQLS